MEIDNEKKIIIAKDLLESFKKDTNIENTKIIKEFSGKEFKGTICSHPFYSIGYDYEIPMLEARFVTTEQGTGIVHCAPSHGPDDLIYASIITLKLLKQLMMTGDILKTFCILKGYTFLKLIVSL